jgi:hypothetical protein
MDSSFNDFGEPFSPDQSPIFGFDIEEFLDIDEALDIDELLKIDVERLNQQPPNFGFQDQSFDHRLQNCHGPSQTEQNMYVEQPFSDFNLDFQQQDSIANASLGYEPFLKNGITSDTHSASVMAQPPTFRLPESSYEGPSDAEGRTVEFQPKPTVPYCTNGNGAVTTQSSALMHDAAALGEDWMPKAALPQAGEQSIGLT